MRWPQLRQTVLSPPLLPSEALASELDRGIALPQPPTAIQAAVIADRKSGHSTGRGDGALSDKDARPSAVSVRLTVLEIVAMQIPAMQPP